MVKRPIKENHGAAIAGKEYGFRETKAKCTYSVKKTKELELSQYDGIHRQDMKLRNVTAVLYVTTPRL